MAKVKAKAAKAGGAAAAAKTAPYVQRLVQDEELRENIRTAVDSGRAAYGRLSNGKGPTAVFDDKKLHRDLQNAATAFKDAADALREGPKRRRRKGGLLRKLIFLSLLGGAVAVGVNEGMRNKVLDMLFGKEEEFDYQSTTAPATPPPAPAAQTAANSS